MAGRLFTNKMFCVFKIVYLAAFRHLPKIVKCGQLTPVKLFVFTMQNIACQNACVTKYRSSLTEGVNRVAKLII